MNVNNKDKCNKKITVHGLILSCSVPLLNACEKMTFRLTTNIEQLAASDIMHSGKIMLLCSSTNSPTLYYVAVFQQNLNVILFVVSIVCGIMS